MRNILGIIVGSLRKCTEAPDCGNATCASTHVSLHSLRASTAIGTARISRGKQNTKMNGRWNPHNKRRYTTINMVSSFEHAHNAVTGLLLLCYPTIVNLPRSACRPRLAVPTDFSNFGPGREFHGRRIEACGRVARGKLKRGVDLVGAKEVLDLPRKRLEFFE